jgi:predicted acylesterase/phospholipase RssA
MRHTLARLIDFERVTMGGIRVSVLACDLETGKEVVFDTAR